MSNTRPDAERSLCRLEPSGSDRNISWPLGEDDFAAGRPRDVIRLNPRDTLQGPGRQIHDLERKRRFLSFAAVTSKLRAIRGDAAKKQAGIRGVQQNGCAADGRNFQERDAIGGLFIEIDFAVVQLKIAFAYFVERDLRGVQNTWRRYGRAHENQQAGDNHGDQQAGNNESEAQACEASPAKS